MSKPKVVDYFAEMRKALPERHISQEEADAFGEAFKRFAEKAKAAGWTPEYIAKLDAERRRSPT
jgi:hypothetical protein